MEEISEEDKCYLGLDISTQQIKAVVINQKLEVTAETHVHFDSMLPEYRTSGGVHSNGRKVTSPTIMWVHAMDMLMDKLRVAGLVFSNVVAISGAGQQHGSVYWRRGATELLASCQPDKFLHTQLSSAFSIQDSPIWMDSSTTDQCSQLEQAAGGPVNLAKVTGSRAYERFTGSQIRKLVEQRPECYNITERISLVSSFAASLFAGKIVSVDWSDAGGMNLLDITTRAWDKTLLDAVGCDLAEKLGIPVSSNSIVGTVSEYMQERYGFREDCIIAAFTGDNPSSLAGLALKPGDIGLSLGTSDTVFVWLDSDSAHPQLTGHVWPNPVLDEAYMALLCYKNGSLTRERIRDSCANGDWGIFNELIDSTPRGNFGNIGMYFDHPEIVPDGIQGDFRFNKNDEAVVRFASIETEVRALVEGQMMAKRLHAEKMGFKVSPETRILVTGGASVNKNILQVIADVFNMNVYSMAAPNSAALGGAYRAKYCFAHQQDNKQDLTFSQMTENVSDSATLVAAPNKDASTVYGPLIERFKSLENYVVKNFNETTKVQ